MAGTFPALLGTFPCSTPLLRSSRSLRARGRSKLSYSERRKSWPFSVLESPNRSYIPRLVIVGLGRSVGELPVRFLVTWPVGRCVKNQPHDNIDPRRCHCVPWHGGLPPMEAASSLGAGERRSPRWLRPPGVQKRAKTAAGTEARNGVRAALLARDDPVDFEATNCGSIHRSSEDGAAFGGEAWFLT